MVTLPKLEVISERKEKKNVYTIGTEVMKYLKKQNIIIIIIIIIVMFM